MKKLFLFLVTLIMTAVNVNAQTAGVAINNDATNPDPSAMLDVESFSGGLLIPRMTTNQMNSIYNPATGLLVYNLDTKSIWRFDEQWENTMPVENPDALYIIGPLGDCEIGNNGYVIYCIPIPGVQIGDIPIVSSQGNPNNGGNIIPYAWAGQDTVFVKLTNSSNNKNYPKGLDYTLMVHPAAETLSAIVKKDFFVYKKE
jgi:hypothetical protein